MVMRGAPTDNNATLFANGYLAVLQPLFSAGTYKDVANPAGTWDPPTALTEFQAAYSAHPSINAVLMPNDENGAPIIHYLITKGIKPMTFPVTGQDATLTGLQNVIAGYQCGTVYKPIYLEAQAAAALAMYLRAGVTPPAALVNGIGDGREHPRRRAVDPGDAGVGRADDDPVHGHQGRLRARVPAVLGLVRRGLLEVRYFWVTMLVVEQAGASKW